MPVKKLLLALACGIALPASASTSIELWENAYRVDTLAHFHIGPGTTHTHLLFSSPGRNLDVVVVTLDKTDDSYTTVIKPRVEIGCDEAREVERTSEIAIRKSGGDRQYISSINCDFFYMTNDNIPERGYPVNGTVIDGKIATPSWSNRQGIIIAPDGMWIDDVHKFSYTLTSADGSTSVSPLNVNSPWRDADRLYVYNDYMQGKKTTSADWDRDLCLVMAEGSQWAINKPMKFKVSAPWRNGAGEIPEGGIVITATTGYSNEWLDNLKEGDELTFEVGFTLSDGSRPDVQHLVSGDVHFLNNGATEWNPVGTWYPHLYTKGENYPMSMAGISASRDRFVMASISRNGPNKSTGINYPEAADLMRFLGCDEALNFDGGGSTTMYAAPMGIVSFLQYDVERPVGNGLFLAMDSPVDKEVASIRFADATVNISHFATYTPTVYGYNKYGQLVDMDVRDFTVDASTDFAVDGDHIIADNAGTFAMHISKGDMHASVAVNVSADEPEVECPAVVIDRVHSSKPMLRTIVDGYYKDIATTAFTWESANPGIAAVDENSGEITAIANGTTTVTGRRGDLAITIDVAVEIPVGSASLPVDLSFADNTWAYEPDGIAEGATVVKNADNDWTLTFASARKRGISLRYAKDFVVYGLPGSASLTIGTNGSVLSGATLSIETANGRGSFEVAAESKTEATVDNGGELTFDFAKYFDTTDYSCYPLTFHALTILPFCNATGAAYTLGLKDFNFEYSDFDSSSVGNITVGEGNGCLPLLINGMTVTAPADVLRIEIFSIDGRLVSSAEGRSASVAAHGIYIVRARTSAGTLTTKAIL